MSDNITKRVGLGTAYGFAKAGGYEGTVEEFTELLGNIAIDLARIENLSVTVTTLPAGSQATASLNGSVLSLGIPKGDKGDKGNTGDTGAPAGFGTVSATVDDAIGTPSVEVTASGADTAKNFAFAFHNLKGQKGDKGDTGDVTLAQLEDFTVVQTDENVEPYNFRATPKCGHIERLKKVVGVSVAFNQLVDGLQNFTNTETDTRATLQLIIKRGVGTSAPSVYADTFGATGQRSAIFNNTESGTGLYMYHNGSTRNIEMKLVSGFTWNANHKYMLDFYLASNDPTTVGGLVIKNFMLTDLTLALGSTIADYVYSLEQATAGSGVAWLKQHFPKMFGQYNAYDAGSIRSVEGVSEHKVVGFNQWDEEWERGGINISDGAMITSINQIRSKNYCAIIPNTTYYATCQKTDGGNQNKYYLAVIFYDDNKTFISGVWANNLTFTPPENARYFKISTNSGTVIYGGTYNHDICINISDTSKNGTYEPYTVNSYPLDSDLTLRGKFKLDSNNNLYADGDEYYPSEGVDRKWTEVDLGSLEWQKSSSGNKFYATVSPAYPSVNNLVMICARYAFDGVGDPGDGYYGDDKTLRYYYYGSGSAINELYIHDEAYSDASAFKASLNGATIVYPLATPTTETADPFTENQICEAGGTEEFVSTSIVPIGHETEYPLTLSDIRPTANGNYVLKCTVTNGKASYEWVSA